MEYSERCESVAPDSEDFDSVYTNLDQDAAFAICCILGYLTDEAIEKIVQAAVYAIDDKFDSADPDLESKILNHPLMQRELKRQHDDILYLKNEKKGTTPTTVKTISHRWRSKSNIASDIR